MPLEHSASKPAFKRNVAALMHDIGKSPHVRDQKQALAIAFATKDRAARGHWSGGVAGYDAGGGVADPVNAVINALTAGSGTSGASTGTTGAMGAMNPSAPSSTVASAMSNPTPAPATGISTPNATAGVAAATSNPITASLLAKGGVPKLAGGGFNMAQGPQLNPPWFEKNEVRGLHVGPVLSAVPGRTDNHQVKVPAGSYVLPAQHVASMGQGNTLAGMSVASKMFGGPYGASAPKIAHGAGAPRPPKAFGGFSSGGAQGAHGHHYEPVPVDISGGEFVIPPWVIVRRYGSLKKGHAALDKWVMATRKKEIETQKRLPPPAKS